MPVLALLRIFALLKKVSMGIMSQETKKILREHKYKWSIEKILWQKHPVFGLPVPA